MALRGGGNPRRIARTNRTSRSGQRYKVPAAAESLDQGIKKCPSAALEAARDPDARQFAHEEAQIRAADVHQQALEDVGMAAQIHAAQPSGFVEMGVGTFTSFAALAQQPLPAGALNPPPIAVHRVAGLALSLPVAPAASRLRHVTPDVQVGQRDQRRVAVIPLIPDHLGEAGPVRQHRFDLLGRRDQRLDHRRRIAGVRRPER